MISILNLEKESYKIHITDLSCELYKSWCQIDILWDKINTGFLIACYLSDFSKDEAIIYLNQSTELKQKEAFSSDATAKTYIKSIKLSIKAFCGLILFEDNLLKPLELLDHEISVLQSNGEKLKLWSEIHLRLLIHKKKDISEMVYKRFIYPLLNEWESNIVDSYRVDTIVSIIPSIYKHNIGIFNDYFEKFDNNNKDSSINRICNFILTKLLSDDPCSEKQKIDKLEYSDINDISDLILKATNDFLIYNLIGKTVKAIKDNKASLTTEQKNHLKQKLKNIINTQFPVNTGIKHEGYKILAESEVLSLEIYDEKEWNHLISRANAIPNISDKAIILVQLAEVITIKSSNKKKVALMENAYNFIKMIPSIYDKTNRYDGTWEILYEIDQNQFKKHIKLAYQDILSCKDGEITAIKNLVDVAQQHDSQLAQEFITMLDKDPARQKLKNPLLKRVENKEKVDKACKQIELTIKLGDDQFREAYNNILTDFNDGRKVSKDISDTFQILDKASELSLDDAFDSYAYFIQNACKKYESNKKDKDNLNSIFYATIENTRLIGILSSDSINKMKNLYNINKESHVNPVISSGEKEKAIQYLKKWFSENVEKNLIIIDPYFTEDELNLIQLIQEVSPQCSVKVLTSKKSKNNNYIDSETGKSNNKDIYIKKWQSISSDKPLNLTVKIVWDKDTLECPFHDRWYVNEDCKSKKGLAVGTSFNGLGNRDSQINELDSDGYSNVNGLINKYLYREEAKVENFNLKYERFDLED